MKNKNGFTEIGKVTAIFLIAILIIVIGTLSSKPNGQTKTETGYKYRTTTIEGCEYFVNRSYGTYYILTHKGNCTNVIHRSGYE